MCIFNFRISRPCAILSCCILLLLSGCSRSAGPQRMAVNGSVQFEGSSMRLGRIRFVPAEGTFGPIAVTSVRDGIYKFTTQNGPVLGRHRVEIESIPDVGFEVDDEAAYAKAQSARQNVPFPPQPVPLQYNQRSTLLATVDSRGRQRFDFRLDKPAETGLGTR